MIIISMLVLFQKKECNVIHFNTEDGFKQLLPQSLPDCRGGK
jgi:hypothetical protein